jgi:ethanolamine ammonia-lyase small subunit
MSGDDLWFRLAKLTPARIALGRTGSGLPTRETLRFALAHAQARDAVHAPFDADAMVAAVKALGLEACAVASRAESRQAYLLRPDLGRRLAAAGEATLRRLRAGPSDIAITIADGLSARAVQSHAIPVLEEFLSYARNRGWSLAPVAVASEARVALGDEVGASLGARLALVMIGERPGLSSPDSLGLYLTFDPRPGRLDGERNCLSNVHGGGMSPKEAAYKASWLIGEAFARRLTGVDLKDESGKLIPNASAPGLPPS